MLTITYAIFSLIGLAFGSFGSVIVTRMPLGKSIGGRSVCPQCGQKLRVHHLIPVFSYILQRGRCTLCRKSISTLYLLLEVGSAAIFVGSLAITSSVLHAGILAFALWFLLLIAVIDGRTQTIPDQLAVPFAFLGIILNFAVDRTLDLQGAGLAFAFFGTQWLVSRGRWIGSGDILLGVGIGFLLGDLRTTLIALFATYIIGACIALLLLASRRISRKSHIAFAPFLAVGTFTALLLGPGILQLFWT